MPAAYNPVVQASFLIPRDVRPLTIFATKAAQLSTVEVLKGDRLQTTMPEFSEIVRRHHESKVFQSEIKRIKFSAITADDTRRLVLGDDLEMLYKIEWGNLLETSGTHIASHVNSRHSQTGQILILPNGDRVDYDSSNIKQRFRRIASIVKPPAFRPPVKAIPKGPDRERLLKERQARRNPDLQWQLVGKRKKVHHEKDGMWVPSETGAGAEELEDFDADAHLQKMNRRAFADKYKSFADIAAINPDELRSHASSFNLVKSASITKLRRSIAKALGYRIPKKKSTAQTGTHSC
jgi:hypothetical protein